MIALPFVMLALVVSAIWARNPRQNLSEEIKWTGGNDMYMSSSALRDKLKSENVLATRTAIYKNSAFLVSPRHKPGVPFTLAKMDLEGENHTQTPFPKLAMQKLDDCSALQNVVDIFLDPYDILWALDIGKVNSLELIHPVKCSPKIIALNATTGKFQTEKSVMFEQVTTPYSQLQHIVVDYNSHDNAFVYVSDAAYRSILVMDVAENRGYELLLPEVVPPKVASSPYPFMQPEVIFVNLVRRDSGNKLLVAYRYRSHMFYVNSSALQDGTASTGAFVDLGRTEGFTILGNSNAGNVFFRKGDESDVYQCDAMKCNQSTTLVYKGSSDELATHVVPDYTRGGVRLLQSNFSNYFYKDAPVAHSLKLVNVLQRTDFQSRWQELFKN